MHWWWPFRSRKPEEAPTSTSEAPVSRRPSFLPDSPWWWPFGKRARVADKQFKEMLGEALLRQSDLEAATERLKDHRTKKRR